MDNNSNIYLAGSTVSTNFPVLNAYQSTCTLNVSTCYSEAYIVKISASGDTLLYGTYLGDSTEDVATALVVDDNNQVYVAGYTTENLSWNDCTDSCENVIQGRDVFLVKLDLDKTGTAQLEYGRTFGGAGAIFGDDDDYPMDIARDSQGNVVVVGHTQAADFPFSSPGVVQPNCVLSPNNSCRSGFVTRFVQVGESLGFNTSTFLGGSSGTTEVDAARGVEIGSDGYVYVAGTTNSSDFPVNNGAFTTNTGTDRDAFLVKLPLDLTSIVYGTYLGGSGHDWGFSVDVNDAGIAYVTGFTGSTNFPTTENAIQATNSGYNDVFFARIDTTQTGLDSLLESTYWGGLDGDYAYGITELNGTFYIAGETYSNNLPIVNGYQTSFGGGVDGFLLRLQGTQVGYVSCQNEEVFLREDEHEGVNFRSASNLSSEVLNVIPPGTEITPYGRSTTYSEFGNYQWIITQYESLITHTLVTGYVAETEVDGNGAPIGLLFIVPVRDCPDDHPLEEVTPSSPIDNYDPYDLNATAADIETEILLFQLATDLIKRPSIQQRLINECALDGWSTPRLNNADPPMQGSIWDSGNAQYRRYENLNTCGKFILNSVMYEEQNLYNDTIVSVATEYGIPPWLLKGLLLQESQMRINPTENAATFSIAQIENATASFLIDIGIEAVLEIDLPDDDPTTTSENESVTALKELLDGQCDPPCGGDNVDISEVENAITAAAFYLNYLKGQIEEEIMGAIYENRFLPENVGTDKYYPNDMPSLTSDQAAEIINWWELLSENPATLSQVELELTIASYNAGINTVRAAMHETARQNGIQTDFSWNAIEGNLLTLQCKADEARDYVEYLMNGTPSLPLSNPC